MGDDLFDVSAALSAWDAPGALAEFNASWADRTWMNCPGPLYTGDGDNCGTGPLNAPNNVAVDPKGYEVIFRQPTSRYELQQVIQAAWADPLNGYGLDGNEHWTYRSIQAWWAHERVELETILLRERETQIASSAKDYKDYSYLAAVSRWLDYLHHGMYEYLQAYAFFLEHGRAPNADEVRPDL